MAINCLPTSEPDKSVQLVRLGSLTAQSKMPTLALKLAMESYSGIKVMAQCTVMGSAAYKGLPLESLLLKSANGEECIQELSDFNDSVYRQEFTVEKLEKQLGILVDVTQMLVQIEVLALGLDLDLSSNRNTLSADLYSSPNRIQSINELNSLKLFSKLVKYWSTPHEFEPSTSAAITWRPVRHTGEGGSPRPLHLQTSRKRESIPFLRGGRLKSAGSSVARAKQGGGKAAFDRAR